MKVRAKANGNVVDVSDGEGEALLASGIYEPVDAPKKSTKVEPLTTADVNPRAGKPSTSRPKNRGKAR